MVVCVVTEPSCPSLSARMESPSQSVKRSRPSWSRRWPMCGSVAESRSRVAPPTMRTSPAEKATCRRRRSVSRPQLFRSPTPEPLSVRRPQTRHRAHHNTRSAMPRSRVPRGSAGRHAHRKVLPRRQERALWVPGRVVSEHFGDDWRLVSVEEHLPDCLRHCLWWLCSAACPLAPPD